MYFNSLASMDIQTIPIFFAIYTCVLARAQTFSADKNTCAVHEVSG